MKFPLELEDLIFGDRITIELKGISRESIIEDINSIFHTHFIDGCIAGHFVDEESDQIIYDIDLCSGDRKTASIRMIDLGEKIILQKNDAVNRNPAFSVH